ncbi:MAG: LON peptidase substrate-binding domain-containing protein [Phycisphaerales bacterium]|nr:LON peptidase substrate-binding domain-containing protein [Phycisphaerales bacterium]
MPTRLSVNFARPLPVFPLPETVLLPHTTQRLHIFEARYRQMITHALDHAGQICMACFDGDTYKMEYEGCPPIRNAVCVGQIVQHDRLDDGRYNIELLGICRARISTLLEPAGDCLYRQATVEPLEPIGKEPPALPEVRETLHAMMGSPTLRHLHSADRVREWTKNEAISTHALLEVVGFVMMTDHEVRYRLLAEGNMRLRARLIFEQLNDLSRLIAAAQKQPFRDWPKGVSWN